MIYGLTVGKNEEHRYLEPMLQAAAETFDELFFYDDQSTDNTTDIAAKYASFVFIRPHNVPSFVEHEGQFREGAWHAFELFTNVNEGDWVFVIDCDEVLVAGETHLGVHEALRHVANITQVGAVNIGIPEVFGFEEQVPMVRVDGLWPTIFAPRLFRYKRGGHFAAQHFGVPAQPTYVLAGARGGTDFVYLMHYGYADPRDRMPKYQRYRGQAGHSNAHVNSIMEPPELEPWTGSFDSRMRRNGNG